MMLIVLLLLLSRWLIPHVATLLRLMLCVASGRGCNCSSCCCGRCSTQFSTFLDLVHACCSAMVATVAYYSLSYKLGNSWSNQLIFRIH